ncbi:hypothetical protein RM844_09850 [Streptomyces sp. DSM 44915]|uniref:Transglutaminase-like domain-containing protein n=1 Tax=Streptomyces chisholmiae TaxID=3075540 RepID=A0ABU2JNN2_9ACTN|nr:hypothetical protein [Streptomyces sp. DSM 44915]MDT0266596.1 hypothetical protein [Streptomyces sp. DSM 44915]
MTGPSEAELTRLLAKVRRVPDRHRVFTETPRAARRTYRVGDELLARLLDLGLPSRYVGDELRLDPLDLRNVAIALRLNAPWFVAMRWWAAALRESRDRRSATYRLDVHTRCPDCGRDGGCVASASAHLTAAAAEVRPRPGGRADLAVTVRLTGRPEPLPEPVAEVTRVADGVEWHLLPYALDRDLGFLRETGLADCRLMAHHLHREARRRGLTSRRCHGLIVCSPFSRPHDWVEFEVAGRWLPADPLLMTSMAAWGYLDPAEWPPHTAPSGTLWRVADEEVPLVTHGDRPAWLTLPTTRLPEPEPESAPGPEPAPDGDRAAPGR